MSQCTSALVMVPPRDFAFNTQTGADNGFQQRLRLSTEHVRAQAMHEFTRMVAKLRDAGVRVLVFEPQQSKPMPDAVFPNNWFTTAEDGSLTVYPMATENRRLEVQPGPLTAFLQQQGFTINHHQDWRTDAQHGEYLEGTGVMVFDHPQKCLYAAHSLRCHPRLLQAFADAHDYQLYAFDTRLSTGDPVYHTNVMMSVGEGVAVICDDVIATAQREAVIRNLSLHHEVISISEAQLGQFCGNILQVKNTQGQPLMLMSESAFNAFSTQQKDLLSRHGTLLPCAIPTIEQIGGGSVRCMLAEIFLPQG